MAGQKVPKWVHLQAPFYIDRNVSIGYVPGRQLADKTLYIGRNARIRSNSIIYAGSRIGENLETGHNVVIREENIIENNFKLWSCSFVDYKCRIGNDVLIHCNSYIAQFTTMEDGVFVGPGVMMLNDPCPRFTCQGKVLRGPTIKRDAKIGANATILPGVIIGESAFIGAGSVVTKDIPANSLAYGNPARVVKDITNLKLELQNKCSFRY